MFFRRRNVLKLKNAVYTVGGKKDWKIGRNEWRRGIEERKVNGTRGDVAVVSRSPRRAFGV